MGGLHRRESGALECRHGRGRSRAKAQTLVLRLLWDAVDGLLLRWKRTEGSQGIEGGSSQWDVVTAECGLRPGPKVTTDVTTVLLGFLA